METDLGTTPMTDETINPTLTSDEEQQTSEADKALIKRICQTIRDDKRHHEKAFKRMRRDMYVASHGCDKDWGADKYRANIIGRHINQKTAALYAKNPKATARRRDTLDFRLWDENPQTLLMAYQGLQQMQAQMQQLEMQKQSLATPHGVAAPAAPGAPQADGFQQPGIAAQPLIKMSPVVDPMTQQIMEAQAALAGPMQQAQALIQDVQQGIQRREQLQKFGRTLEILFSHALVDQNPLAFKEAMKQLTRRTATTCVGYIELGWQRQMGPRPENVNKLSDFKSRLDHLQRLQEEVQEGEVDDTDAEIAELQASISALEQEPEILLREGLVFDFPASTHVIPDRACKQLVGFVGADHMTVEYFYSAEKIEEIFGVDLEQQYTPYQSDGKRGNGYDADPDGRDDNQSELPLNPTSSKSDKQGLVCVWKHYDKTAGLVYWVADGFKGWLKPPEAPDVYVDDFWPLRAITFNAVENEDELFPQSDVSLLMSMQHEINRSREGMREHRNAARPRWVFPSGAVDEEDIAKLSEVKPFDAIGLNVGADTDITKVFQHVPVPGVDPNLYETGQFFSDMELTVGAQAAQLGGLAKATATESAIAADSQSTATGSNVDDMDAFLTWVARSSGQIMIRNMDPQTVLKQAGVGAVWPGLNLEVMTLNDIAEEVYLEVEAGSSGKPNQAVEINNWKSLLPYLLQMGSIPPAWLARETLRRLDDRMDLTEAVIEGIPAIVAQNRMTQPMPTNPQNDPNAQGPEGADKNATPHGQSGSPAAMGANHGAANMIGHGSTGAV